LATRTRDPILASEPAREERRRSQRDPVAHAARLRAGDLTIEGEVQDVSTGGVFFGTQLLIEVAEKGFLSAGGDEIAVEVVWLRGSAHGDGPGMGLAFAAGDGERARFHRRLCGG
jgi:PilZ domain-containing protein